MISGYQLLFKYVVPGRKHLANLHKSFVLGLRNDEDAVDGHSQANGTEDQITVGTCGNLK